MKRSINRLSVWTRWFLIHKGFWLRALLCWAISLVFLKFDAIGNYDIRFRIRGDQKLTQEVVLVTLKTSDFSKMYDFKTRSLVNTNELSDLSDSFYWDRKIWLELLNKILSQKPKSIGVTFYFGDNIGQVHLTSKEIITFKDSHIYWATNSNEPEKLSLPIATQPDRSNLGDVSLLKDDDGTTRRLFISNNFIPSLAEKITSTNLAKTWNSFPIINFKGTYQIHEVFLSDILDDRIPADVFSNKIVLIGSEKTINSQIQTPIGVMSKHEFWAQVSTNILEKSFIKKLNFGVYALILLGLTLIAITIINNYPQSVALFFFIWLATLCMASSAWIFDSFYIWVPVIAPISLLVSVWIVFIAYQALEIEKAHMNLQRQQNYLAELEQLKNNFVSLISHDLKTPIAKIQAVVDRLLTQQSNEPEPFLSDLESLKQYSEELNRYIQSILKVLRVESRDFRIVKETADINLVIEAAIERLKPLAATKNIKIETELEPIFLIEFDLTLITEVFINLIENAIKYTPANGLVQIHSYETESDVVVEIKDNGEGISAEDQLVIWNKFSRGKSQDHKTKGTGLGLYLVKYFIELHGGKASLKSELQKGTTFIVTLPFEQS